MLTEEHIPALQGIMASCFTTCSLDGEPNTTVISQIWYVDEKHVALSFQFFNKTKKNISENPFGFATIVNPENNDTYDLEIEYKYSESDGDLFDEMDMKLEAIASMTGMSGIFKLQAADVYKIHSINKREN